MVEVERVESRNKVAFFIKGTKILHREDGPAIEWSDGAKEWFLNGKLHRLDGPAIFYPDVIKKWYINGNHHRVDGPAIERGDGEVEWCLNDIFFGTKEEWFEALNEEQKAKALYSEYFMRG